MLEARTFIALDRVRHTDRGRRRMPAMLGIGVVAMIAGASWLHGSNPVANRAAARQAAVIGLESGAPTTAPGDERNGTGYFQYLEFDWYGGVPGFGSMPHTAP